MKKGIVVFIILWCLTTASPLAASPLYGGYNGESTAWIDGFFFGIDDQIRWWVRIPISLVKGFLNLNFKYESSGVISAELFGYNIPGQGDLLLGIDTSGLFWTELCELDFLAGTDSNGTGWTEQTFFDYVGTGSDSNDHLWGFVTYSYENIYRIKAGIDLSFLIPEPSMGNSPSLAQMGNKRLCSPFSVFKKEKSLKLIHFLTSLSLNDELREQLETLTTHSLNFELLLSFADEEVFTQERREIIESMMNNLMD